MAAKDFVAGFCEGNNRNILECKFRKSNRTYNRVDGNNRNILECKFRFIGDKENANTGNNRNILECK